MGIGLKNCSGLNDWRKKNYTRRDINQKLQIPYFALDAMHDLEEDSNIMLSL